MQIGTYAPEREFIDLPELVIGIGYLSLQCRILAIEAGLLDDSRAQCRLLLLYGFVAMPDKEEQQRQHGQRCRANHSPHLLAHTAYFFVQFFGSFVELADCHDFTRIEFAKRCIYFIQGNFEAALE
ncbi:hypothetical protein D3C78_948130 [compost metagenome]